MTACLMRRFMSMRVAGGDGLLGSCSVFARMASSLAASTSEESNPSKKTKEERSMDSGLVRFLRAETRRMKEGYQEYMHSLPMGFKLKDEPGKMDMTLHRKHGSEDIQMRCELLYQPQGQTEELTQKELRELGIEEELILNLMFRIMKGSQVLELSCECYSNGYTVNHIKVRDLRELKNEEDNGKYFPNFRMRVSPNLKAEIFQYVGERGLNEAILKWVYGWMNNKGFRERLHMLRRVEDFIKH
jgi:hypothetical protein